MSPWSRSPWRTAAPLVALALAIASATIAQEPPALTVPRPDLSAMEETARAKVESMQTTLAGLVLRPDARPPELAEAFGHLGQLYHAYTLLDSAGQCYETSRRLAEDDYRWPYYLGLVHYSQGQLDTAVADFERALSLKPDDPATLLRLGNALLDLDRADEAAARYRRLLEVDPEQAAAVFGLGMVATAGGDFQATVEHFERALELQPEATAIHYPLGQAYRRLGDLDKAREHLQQRGEQEPLFPDPLGNQVARLAKGTAFEIVLALAKSADEYPDDEFLGFALSHFGDVQGAIEQLEQGLALRRQSDAAPLEQGRIHYVLGGLLVNDDRDLEAVEQFRRALELAPELIDARVKLGNAHARLERYDDALAAYDAVLAKQPENPDVLLKRASLLMGLERDGEARPDLEKLAGLMPESSEVQIRLATILEKERDVEGALARYRAAGELELTPQERPRVHYGLASMLRQQEQYNEAVREYQRALEADPELVPALADLASLLAQLGRMREAALYYGLWVGLEPRNLPPRLAEATALILSDQHQRARDRLEAALELFPGTVQVQDVLARHLAACPDREVRDGVRAVELAAAVLEEVPTPQSVETMAMAYAEAGRFEDAVRWQQELLDRLAQEENVPAQMTERLRDNLALYEKGEVCCAE